MLSHTDIVLGVWQRLDQHHSSGSTQPIVLTGHDLTIADVILIARYNVYPDISASATEALDTSLSALETEVEHGQVIYGVNTGFGGSADARTQQVVELQQSLVRELHYGILPPGPRDPRRASTAAAAAAAADSSWSNHCYDLALDGFSDGSFVPWSWARATIAIRINTLISGASGVRPVIVRRMRDLLKHDVIPMIPLRGSISASGDLSPLSYVGGAILGKSTIRVLSKDPDAVYADVALARAGLEPVKLQMKEGLAITNGTAISNAVAAIALHDAHTLALFGQILTAMTVEALVGSQESFHAFFSETRPHPGQTECARNIWAFLEGSKLIKANDGAGSVLRQDRYSIRTAPQWLGPILEDLVLAHQQISIECNSVTDNPLVTRQGELLHGGNFQAKSVTSAMEKTRQAAQGIGRMLFAQCTELINPATNRGLPANLVVEDPSISFIFKGTDLNIASLAAELGFLANPVNHVQTAEMGNQSLNSLALISARYTQTANDVLAQLVASHLVAVCQALDLRAMSAQFLEFYQPQFKRLVEEHYSTLGKGSTIPSTVPDRTASNTVVTQGDDTSQRITSEDSSALSTAESITPSSLDGLFKSFWNQLLVSLDATASMDTSERFEAIAKSLRTIVLDNADFNRDPNLILHLESFTDALFMSMREAWSANRDAYLIHGNAAPLLGKASRAIYTFLRQELRVPLLSRKDLMTPNEQDMSEGHRVDGIDRAQAPTVGSYTGAVYRSVKDGSLMKIATDMLQTCV
ncbi:phenylalanine and histidine ammonia-lyase [Xylariomycetidae sp. FL2044]|nr:phenylalanine and histidine ammonia-lyase [Xylariomycetidae sp. FL2044]